MLCRVSVHQLWYLLSSATLLKVIKVAIFLVGNALVLVLHKTFRLSHLLLRFSELKLDARPGEVNVTVIVGAGNIGHLESCRTVTY